MLCISPALADVEDTLTNLRYGARLLNISNKPVVNRVAVPAEAGDESEDVDLARWDRRWCGRLAAARPLASQSGVGAVVRSGFRMVGLHCGSRRWLRRPRFPCGCG